MRNAAVSFTVLQDDWKHASVAGEWEGHVTAAGPPPLLYHAWPCRTRASKSLFEVMPPAEQVSESFSRSVCRRENGYWLFAL